jgi:hypothetical protein
VTRHHELPVFERFLVVDTRLDVSAFKIAELTRLRPEPFRRPFEPPPGEQRVDLPPRGRVLPLRLQARNGAIGGAGKYRTDLAFTVEGLERID